MIIRRLVLPLIVLIALAVVADRALAYLAGRAIATRVAAAEKLTSTPEVTAEGFPFVTQAVRGRYDRVVIDVRQLQATPDLSRLGLSKLSLQNVRATLHGVHAPLSEVVKGTLTRVEIDSADLSAQVGFTALQTAATTMLNLPVPLHFSAAGPDRVAVSGTLGTTGTGLAALGDISISGQARLSVVGGRIVIALLPQTLTGVPAALRSQLARAVQLRAVVPALPFGVRISSLVVSSAGIALAGHADHLVLAA